MIKKTLLLLVLLFCVKNGFCQQAAYTFPLPQGWNSEKLVLPIDFAPQIPITGMEELRFPPGWSKSPTDEYWAYDFLWFMDGKKSFSSDILQSYFVQYYNGLYLSNLKNKTNAPSNFSQAQVAKVHTLPADYETYEGTITTLDFLNGKPIKFYARIHIRNYTGHTVALFEISPLDYQQPVWAKLDGVINGFTVN